MVNIYCIEDINDSKYVGSTKNKLNDRLTEHRKNKRNKKNGSSKKLNLENCIIYQIESCDEKDRFEREKYWINQIDCVNEKKLNGRDMINNQKYNVNRKRYRASFGGDERRHNNLLLIDVNLFL